MIGVESDSEQNNPAFSYSNPISPESTLKMSEENLTQQNKILETILQKLTIIEKISRTPQRRKFQKSR